MMDEKKDAAVKQDEENDYTVAELFERLKEDESWEPDVEYREMLADMLSMVLANG